MPSHSSDRNLLFGILALQMDFISRDDLVTAMNAWVLDKSRSLGDILRETGRLAADEHTVLELLVKKHLQRHANDAQQSLAAVSAVHSIGDQLRAIADEDVQASVAHATPVPGTTDAEPTVSHTNRTGDTSGCRYRKQRYHRGGGLGDVYVAEDLELHREVALKEIKPDRADDPLSQARFVREAEVTGNLEHPGVVPVYGLGSYADGKPYYAMRFIHGETFKDAIDRYHSAEAQARSASERSLEFRQLLTRFVAVCNAVAYAHSRDVLHRDLKPANVMLGKFGETLVLDWGLAKPRGVSSDVAQPEGDSAFAVAADFTQAGDRLGTLAYSSPEQAVGHLDAMGPASDVYSLGCTLYTVLTGKSPFPGNDADDVLARVCKAQFNPPRQAETRTPPALDAICRKAMALRSLDRYQTPLDLAADVEHWMADEPVGPYRDPWSVRFARWGRQHRMKLVSSVVFLVTASVALSVSTGLVWSEQQKTAEQKRVAADNFDYAVDMGFTGLALIESAESSFAADPILHEFRKAVLKNSADVFSRYLAKDPESVARRERTAQVYRYKANIHRLEGETEAAQMLYAKSVHLIRGLAQEDSKYVDRLAWTLRDQGMLLARIGRLQEGAQSLDEAMSIITAVHHTHPEEPTYWRTMAATLMARATIEYSYGMYAEAVNLANEAVRHHRNLQSAPLSARHPYDPLMHAASINMRAINERELGQLKHALASHDEAAILLNATDKARPAGISVVDMQNYLAAFHFERCRTWARFPSKRRAAETNLGAARTVWNSLCARFATIPEYRESLAAAYLQRSLVVFDDFPVTVASKVGLVSFPSGLYIVAKPDLRETQMVSDLRQAHALQAKLVEDFRYIPGYHDALAQTCIAMGRLAACRLIEEDAAQWYACAVVANDEATRLAPDNVKYRATRAKLEWARHVTR
jgi:serine/threonine-protein kinase